VLPALDLPGTQGRWDGTVYLNETDEFGGILVAGFAQHPFTINALAGVAIPRAELGIISNILGSGESGLYHIYNGPYGAGLVDVHAIPHPDHRGFVFAEGTIIGTSSPVSPATGVRDVTAAEYAAAIQSFGWQTWLNNQASPMAQQVVSQGLVIT
jgi:hypothetical protein